MCRDGHQHPCRGAEAVSLGPDSSENHRDSQLQFLDKVSKTLLCVCRFSQVVHMPVVCNDMCLWFILQKNCGFPHLQFIKVVDNSLSWCRGRFPWSLRPQRLPSCASIRRSMPLFAGCADFLVVAQRHVAMVQASSDHRDFPVACQGDRCPCYAVVRVPQVVIIPLATLRLIPMVSLTVEIPQLLLDEVVDVLLVGGASSTGAVVEDTVVLPQLHLLRNSLRAAHELR